jgi:hypothetical protein
LRKLRAYGGDKGSDMTEEEKARFEALIKLRDFWQARWVSRRDFAWKGTLASWALLVGAIYVVKVRPAEQHLIIGLLAYVLIFSFYWIREIQVRDTRDSRRAFHFNSLAEKILFPAVPVEPKPGEPGLLEFLTDGLAMVQVLGTVTVALAVYWFLGTQYVR